MKQPLTFFGFADLVTILWHERLLRPGEAVVKMEFGQTVVGWWTPFWLASFRRHAGLANQGRKS